MAFRALLFSDIHIFFPLLPFELPDPKLYDIALLAGDLSNGSKDLLLWINDKFKNLGKQLIIVYGNHDYYHQDIDEMHEWALEKGLKVLHSNVTYEVNGYTFVGGTGFTNFQLYSSDPIVVDKYKIQAQAGITDFKWIGYKGKAVTPNDYVTMFNQSWNYIQQFRHKEKVVVMTHFPLSIECLDPHYDTDQFHNLNPYFINNVDLSGFPIVIAGHTHTCVDKIITNKDGSKTRLLI
jgi:predicted phosphodiesterase